MALVKTPQPKFHPPSSHDQQENNRTDEVGEIHSDEQIQSRDADFVHVIGQYGMGALQGWVSDDEP
jgi:hypothetical protein